jgi:hypothetical protein
MRLVEAGHLPARWSKEVRKVPKMTRVTAACLAAFVAVVPLAASHAPAQTPQSPAPPAASLAPKGRLAIWDLKLGATQGEMPRWIDFKGYACGSNGGPPLRRLSGWQDYAQCRPDENGLYEVYFEYDDEAEYILRAQNDPRTVRYVGTTEQNFPVVASALFDAKGILRGIRLVTDPRADLRNDVFFDLTNLRTRADFFLLGPYIGAQVLIDPAKDCINLPLAAGESDVAGGHIKLDCEIYDRTNAVHAILQTRYFRKAGQFARDPRTGTLTQGQYESSTRFEQYQDGYGPASLLAADKAGGAPPTTGRN